MSGMTRQQERAVEAETRRAWRYYMADPDRTIAETAAHFGLPASTLGSRFSTRGWLLRRAARLHPETPARQAA